MAPRDTKENGTLKEGSVKITDHKNLTTVYKKNGSFDQQRKELLENFKQSETHSNLLLKLRLMVENKVKNDPSILMKNKGKMGALIQGEIINQRLSKNEDKSNTERSINSNNTNSLLSIVDKDIQEKIIDSPEFHETLRIELKDIKRKLEGVSDEDYVKILEEEKMQREKELEELEQKKQEKESAYKNNFKMKNMNKVIKPPRFNFGKINNNGNNYNNNNNNNNNNNGNNGDGNSKNGRDKSSNGHNNKPTYLMY